MVRLGRKVTHSEVSGIKKSLGWGLNAPFKYLIPALRQKFRGRISVSLRAARATQRDPVGSSNPLVHLVQFFLVW